MYHILVIAILNHFIMELYNQINNNVGNIYNRIIKKIVKIPFCLTESAASLGTIDSAFELVLIN